MTASSAQSPLYLLEPETPGPAWAPFAGVRPIAELRAGVWLIRERWEAALRMDAAALVGGLAEGFTEGDEPPSRPLGPIEGPAVVASSTFAPSGKPPEVTPGTRRLEHEGTTVGWIVDAGETWTEPHARGPAAPIEGLPLRGTYDLLTALEQMLLADCTDFLAATDQDPVPAGSIILGDPGQVLLRGAAVEPGVVFDVRHGPVVLEPQVEVRHGTRLEGPLYAGPHTRLLGGFIRNSVFGPWCVARGEIASSLFLGFANKGHDGFVGHSVLGHWVNLGAGTTTSNLKNTYGAIRLTIDNHVMATQRTNLGSLIGDHAKTAIGTMLPTGTVIGAGANVFGPTPPGKYVRPLAWGSAGAEVLDEEGFLRVASRVMPRRQVEFSAERRESLRHTYRRLR
jgi:UDP-N-acetylglucosamine diphosphorylase/glucosamine-1-phosphate N-acetyltransferase